MGIGGIGINAVQGASHAGASHVIAVDPVEFKREKAQELGATHSFATMDEAAEFARSVTNGQGADAAIVTIGVLKTEHVAQAFDAIRKAGTVVVTGIGNEDEEVRVPGVRADAVPEAHPGCAVRSVEPEPRHPVDAAACTRTASSSSTS